MSIRLSPKITLEDFRQRSIESSFLKKYYKSLQDPIKKKASQEAPISYFLSLDFKDGLPILLVGKPTPAFKKDFLAAAKGQKGFAKKNVSVGKCFIKPNAKGKACLYLQHAKGSIKKDPATKALKKHIIKVEL